MRAGIGEGCLERSCSRVCGMRDFPCGAVSVQGKVRKKIEEKGTLSGCKNWKLESFRFFQVEEIYTEKMITLSNVSLDPCLV